MQNIAPLVCLAAMASNAQKCFNCFFWLIVLLAFSWWIACICFPLYTLFGILASCFSGLEKLADFFLKGVMFPQICAKNMVKMNRYDAI